MAAPITTHTPHRHLEALPTRPELRVIQGGRSAPALRRTYLRRRLLAGVVLAVALLAANLDRRLTRTKIDEASDGTGDLRFHLADVAEAVAKHLQTADGIRRARGRAEVDRGREVITITLDLSPDADFTAVRRLCEESTADVDAAIGDLDCGTRYLVRLDRPPNG